MYLIIEILQKIALGYERPTLNSFLDLKVNLHFIPFYVYKYKIDISKYLKFSLSIFITLSAKKCIP